MATGGFAISASRFGYPDFGILSYREMRDATIETVRSVKLPTLVDADNGYGNFLNIERLVKEYELEKNISAIFIEDQVLPKRCGHLKGKKIIPASEMIKKIEMAVMSRQSKNFWIIARTRCPRCSGIEKSIGTG